MSIRELSFKPSLEDNDYSLDGVEVDKNFWIRFFDVGYLMGKESQKVKAEGRPLDPGSLKLEIEPHPKDKHEIIAYEGAILKCVYAIGNRIKTYDPERKRENELTARFGGSGRTYKVKDVLYKQPEWVPVTYLVEAGLFRGMIRVPASSCRFVADDFLIEVDKTIDEIKKS